MLKAIWDRSDLQVYQKNPPTQGVFFFGWFLIEEPGGRGPPLKNNLNFWRGGGVRSTLIETTPPLRVGLFVDMFRFKLA